MIDDVNKKCDEAVSLITQLIHESLVKPFCIKYRVKFESGMGSYSFCTRQGTNLIDYNYKVEAVVHHRFKDTQAGKELVEIIKALELRGRPEDRCPIGAYMF